MAGKVASPHMEELPSLTRRESFPVLGLCIQVLGACPDRGINAFGIAEFRHGRDPDALAHCLRERERLAQDLANSSTVICTATIMDYEQQAVLGPRLLGAMASVEIHQELLSSRVQRPGGILGKLLSNARGGVLATADFNQARQQALRMLEKERVVGNEIGERGRADQAEPFFPGERQVRTTSNGFRDGHGRFRDKQFVQEVASSWAAASHLA